MKKALLIALTLLVLFIVGQAAYVWFTIPADLDPTSIGSQPSTLLAPPYAAAIEEARTFTRTLIAEEQLPGLSLAVGVAGELVWAEGFRWADMETETPMTPSTQFRIGGISKAITSAAVGLLLERGKLDLDAPVQSYVDDFPDKHWPLSTRHLMAHTSGLPPHRPEGGLFRKTCVDGSEVIALFAEPPLRFEPNTDVADTTYDWALVGEVVAGASGGLFVDFLRQEIFGPLGMASTTYHSSGEIDGQTAKFYYPRLMLTPRWGVHDLSPIDLSCFVGAAGLLSTPTDLVRFGAAMMNGSLLQPETLDELLRPHRLASGQFTELALGWAVNSVPLGDQGAPTRILGQGLGEVALTGAFSAVTVGTQVAGCTSTLLLVPDFDLVIAVASNVTGAENVPRLSIRLADLFVRVMGEA